jgi:hypothetical protein
MPDLNFQVEGVEAVAHAAEPQLVFKLRITNADLQEAIQNVGLRCQIQIQATRRRYAPEEQARLTDLFGEPEFWSRTLGTLLWTHVNVVVPPFSGETTVNIPVPCTFDFNVAATKYFHGVADGEIPLAFLFSGTIFHRTEESGLRVAQISWDKEAHFRLKVQTWHQMMDLYYPNCAWLRLRRDVFDRLYQFKIRRGLPTWETTLESLLNSAEAEAEVAP